MQPVKYGSFLTVCYLFICLKTRKRQAMALKHVTSLIPERKTVKRKKFDSLFRIVGDTYPVYVSNLFGLVAVGVMS